MARRNKVASDATSRATYGVYTLPHGEQKVLFAIVKMDAEGEANINGKNISRETKYNRGHVSRLVRELVKKELIVCIEQGSQKLYAATKKGLILWSILNGGSPVDATSRAKNATCATFVPHDIYFKGPILSAKTLPDHWETVKLKGRTDHICREYDCTVQIMTSEKSGKQWIQIYVPAFPVKDLKTTNYEAYKRAREVAMKLQKNYGIKVGPLSMVHAHVATDLFTSFISPEMSKVTSESGEWQIDQSPGYNEVENMTKYAQDEWERILNVLFDPVANGEFDPVALLRHIRMAQMQIRTDQILFADNLKEHVKLVRALHRVAEVLEQQAKENKKKKENGLLKKIKESGQKLLEDFL